MKTYLHMLIDHQSLSYEEMKTAAQQLFQDDITDSEIAAFLVALKSKGETVDEIAGLVEALLKNARPFPKEIKGVMDNCGTGGDGSSSFNVSSTSAFVIAGAGIKVAKHGNRSVSSKTGSADVLEALGVNLHMPQEAMEELLHEIGIAFLFAPHVHPKLGRIMKVRRDLSMPTIFNLIGPLTNPIALDYQLVGIYDRRYVDTFAAVLNKLGRKRAVVINGAGSMDEASLQGENFISLLENGSTHSFTLTPEEVGLKPHSNNAIVGGDAQVNAQILKDVLNGQEGAHRETVLLNAGLGIYAAGGAATVQEGIKLARESIDSGRAYETLRRMIEKSKKEGIS